ncbi:MAG: DUF1080 domain-containing protein [Verrucomicrobia bacterium]|nr:DUF1080 domain-containing protein [Verrucomicrobiota bacterium]
MKRLCLAVLLCAGTLSAQEEPLLAVLKSGASPAEKAAACRELARVGTAQAVPVLEPLLADESLSDMARFALEPIPDPAADAALRSALGKVNGRMRVGVISSMAVRKDPGSVGPLGGLLSDPDPAVAQAAARALGAFGAAAVPVLDAALAKCEPANRPSVTEGLLACAGEGPESTAIYDKLRALPDLPEHSRIAALRGAVRSRGAAGLAVLADAIRSGKDIPSGAAIRIAMEIQGPDVTRLLVAELAAAPEPKRMDLVQALGLRRDATAEPALVPLAQGGPVELRTAAVRSLSQIGSASSLPLFASLATGSEPTVAAEAMAGLVGISGKDADQTLIGMANAADPKHRPALVAAIGQRRIEAGIPKLLEWSAGADAGLANASLKALRDLGRTGDIPGVAAALAQPATLSEAEAALAAICARETQPGLSGGKLIALLPSAQGGAKLAVLRVLGKIGDPAARTAVDAAAKDADPAVRAEAAKVLSEWPAEPGFVPIFNGRDLAGWNGKPGWWKVEDGALTSESTPEKPCKECNYLIWRGDRPADFELLAEYKISAQGNSGIQIRSEELPNWDTFGYQADLTGDGSLTGFVYHHQYALIAGRGEKVDIAADGKKTTSPLADPADLLKRVKPGDWNTYHIICRGSAITLSINGTVMCEITDHRVKPENARGIIALQMHPGPPMKIQFRNLRLKRL